MLRKLGVIILYAVLIPMISSLAVMFFAMYVFGESWFYPIAVPVLSLLFCVLLTKRNDQNRVARIYGILLLILVPFFTFLFYAADGDPMHDAMKLFMTVIFPFFPISLMTFVMAEPEYAFLTAFLTYLACFLFALWKSKYRSRLLLIPTLALLLCTAFSCHLYTNRPSERYEGHGFDYMNGFSSTDFTDYTVYAENSRLVTLDHPSEFQIAEEEEMPVMDGAEACYPLYAAYAKAVYQNIDQIEEKYLDTDEKYHNGKIVSFTNTIRGFQRLVIPDAETEDYAVNLFFGARPSEEQMQQAEEFNTEIEITPIGREAFVFFTVDDNPVTDISASDMRAIYSGKINNWKEVGGNDQEIRAFQRPENSGSQTMMEYFMGDTELMQPDTYDVVGGMGGVIQNVSQYANEEGALGYFFRYFLEGLRQEKGVRMLKIDGIEPSLENIENGSYPLTVDLVLITRKNDPNPNVAKMKEFILSEDGQQILHDTGYGRLTSE